MCFSGEPMPLYLGHHSMIPSPNGKGVLVIGGETRNSNGNFEDKIYELKCTNSLEDCKWTTLKQELKYGRKIFISMLIPDSLANDLCL